MNNANSCSACCGVFNLDASADERAAWITENTQQFLALDLAHAENIVRFRRDREAVTLPRRIREDIYVCPFVGQVSATQVGCLLHPQGSPHSQIGLWEHPQNFSFYGEGICLAYDCLAKERRVYRAEFFEWARGATVQQYARLASDHTLHRALANLAAEPVRLGEFYTILAEMYERYRVVTTSFEDIEKTVPATAADLCHFLATRIAAARVRLEPGAGGQQPFVDEIEAALLAALVGA